MEKNTGKVMEICQCENVGTMETCLEWPLKFAILSTVDNT